MYRLQESIKLKLGLKDAWDFFCDPSNLSLITPPQLGMKITSELPKKMYAGMIISYQVSPLLGIPMTWVTEITHVEPLKMFVDEQRYGPYRMWHHQHFIKEIEGGVEVEDIVDYIMPFGPLGKLANTLMVKKQVSQIFEYRSKVLAEKFGEIE